MRSKKAGVTLAKLAVKATTASIPGASLAVDGIEHLIKHASQFYQDRKDTRLKDFHKRLLEEDHIGNWDDIKDKEIKMDEYYSLLNNVIQDEEEEKIDFYSKIFRILLSNKVHTQYRSHIIKSARELKYSDIELMRQIYINEKIEFKQPGNRTLQVRALTETKDPLRNSSIQTLIRFGYLTNSDDRRPPWPTDLLSALVENYFDESKLKADKAFS